MFLRRWSASCNIAWRKILRHASIPPAILRLISNIFPGFPAQRPRCRKFPLRIRVGGFCWVLALVWRWHWRCWALVGGLVELAAAHLWPNIIRSLSAQVPSAMPASRLTAVWSTVRRGTEATTSFIFRVRMIRVRASWDLRMQSCFLSRRAAKWQFGSTQFSMLVMLEPERWRVSRSAGERRERCSTMYRTPIGPRMVAVWL